MLFVDRHKQ